MYLQLVGTNNTTSAIVNKNIYWYTCGPTVYDYSHIGHARTYVTDDILRKVLKYMGYNVFSVMNITDIDDKIIKKARELDIDFKEVSRRYTELFFNDMDKLGVYHHDIITFVSDYVNDIIEFVKNIVNNKFGYESNGSVYLDMNRYYSEGNKDYLFDAITHSASIKSHMDEYLLKEKKDMKDFAIWKASKPNEPYWPSPFGDGRPAWHIECSVMIDDTLKIFKKSVMTESYSVIHTGGEDLIFPHHENEIKQFVAATGENPINTFLHYGRLNINGEKMSKSEKNYVSIKDVLVNYDPQVIRMLFVMRNWDERIEYNEGSMDHARALYDKIDNFVKHMSALLKTPLEHKLSENDKDIIIIIECAAKKYDEMLNNSLNISKAFETVVSIVNTGNNYINGASINRYVVRRLCEFVKFRLNVFGISLDINKNSMHDHTDYIHTIVKIRDDIRTIGKSKIINKNDIFNLTDSIRDAAPDLGFVIEDKGSAPSIWYYN
jgi:cysteinyl-tRNA synthetase